MGICPNCGSWVDEGDICMGCGGSGGSGDIDSVNDSKIEEFASKAWDYYLNHRYEDALVYIDLALDLDYSISENWNKKGIILGALKRYSESENCFNKSLKLANNNRERSEFRDNKARMLYDWSDYLLMEAINSSTSSSYPSSEAIDKIKEAKMKIAKAIDTISKSTDEYIEKYCKKKKEIESWEYSIEAWNCYASFEDEGALVYINLALDLDDMIPGNWNRKGIILEGLKRYSESEECYNRSLELSKSRIVQDNKARMLYNWSNQLIIEAKKLSSSERLNKLKEAKNIITRAITAIHDDSVEDIEIYLNKRDEVNFDLDGEGLSDLTESSSELGDEVDFDLDGEGLSDLTESSSELGDEVDFDLDGESNLESLKGYDKSELFTITGTDFYKSNLTPGLHLKLVKEPRNEYDGDAIGVYLYGEKIGYVANNVNTRYELTSSASELQDKIDDITKGVYLFSLEGIFDNRTFHIGRIIY